MIIPVLAVMVIALGVTLTALPLRHPHTPPPTVARSIDRVDTLARIRLAHDLAEARLFEQMLAAGLLGIAAPPVRDPGNGFALLRLVTDPYGAVTAPHGRLLLAYNPPTGHGDRELHAIPVPPDSRDPIDAAAWSYDVTRDRYLELARRT